MRTLHFNPNQQDQDTYQLLYQATLYSDRGFSGAETRVLAKIQTKLEAVGKFDEETKLYGLVDPARVVVELEDAEFNLLRETFASTKWRGIVAKKVAVADEYLEKVANATPA